MTDIKSSRPPSHCPKCGTELYPIARMRPDPALSIGAKLLIALSGLVAATVAWGLYLYIRSRIFIPTRLLAPLVFFLGIIPAIPIATYANSFAYVQKLRCWKCHWTGAFPIGGRRRMFRMSKGQCVHCGYDLKGNTSGVCPECGTKS